MKVLSSSHQDMLHILHHIKTQIGRGANFDQAIERLTATGRFHPQKIELVSDIVKGNAAKTSTAGFYKGDALSTVNHVCKILRKADASEEDIARSVHLSFISGSQHTQSLWKSIQGTGVYFFVILGLASIFWGIYTVKVLPQFHELFLSVGGELPPMTVTFLVLSEYGTWLWVAFILLTIWLMSLLVQSVRKFESLDALSRYFYYIPTMRRLYLFHQKFRVLSLAKILLSANKSATEALSQSLDLVFPKELSDKLSASSNPYLEDLMIASELDTLEPEIQIQYDSLIQECIARLEGFREKYVLFMQVLLGFIVSLMVIAMYLPLFQLGNVV